MKWFKSLSVLLLLTGAAASATSCSKSETKSVTAKADKQEEVQKLSAAEVQSIVHANLTSIFHTLQASGAENGWSPAKPADFAVIKPKLLPYVTEDFADSTLKQLVSQFYCECDASFEPKLNDRVRFRFEQAKRDELSISALDPAIELSNTGSMWKFILAKEQGRWKMKQWDKQSLSGQDIKLTKEEAAKLLASDAEQPAFVREYTSKSAGGTAYVFQMQSASSNRMAAISSRDTQLVYDFEEQQQAAAPAAAEQHTKAAPAKQQAKSKTEYLAQLAKLEEKEQNTANAMNEVQRLEMCAGNLELWDTALNDIYSTLKTQLSPSQMEELRNKQRQWIADRDTAAQAKYDEEGGGSLSRFVKVESLMEWTKKHCFELVHTYML
ncbi:lysozyme inhibitor LprI family protein [Ectobacillus ponti]|uniref:DUF1311 domain-containing protein n=1 Tax=Ectobacillus ponti TaxID=2961894 RepID=A0AA42BQZ3_9BACI|nr:lysozyme inhibitor LprI family protein [Ectobacillus ponti]MCP8968964.1 DUF1311 domain-containing protein [Ectobacillus ponti]